uniref:C3H1-type domain-containing protein n=1 Tax=Panagrolaimus sp. ES5 TaxID=591445 RepID=A0AC34G7K0_9BILA
MSGEESDIAKRLIAKLLQFTLPGQVELPLNWVVEGPVEADIVSNVVCDDTIDTVKISSDRGEFSSSQVENTEDENLEDGELLEDDNGDGSIEKENVYSASPSDTLTDFMITSDNDTIDWDKKRSGSKSLKGPGKRQKLDGLICKFFREGKCRKGDSCSFSHNASDSHRIPVLCKGYILGTCGKTFKCQFLHGEHPCKAFHFNHCNSLKCRFSHQTLDDYTRPIFEQALKDEEDAIAAASANTVVPRSPPFSLSPSKNICPASSPPTFSSQPFSKSTNHVMPTNQNSLSYNKNAFRKSSAPYYNKRPSKSISTIPYQNVTVDSLLADIALNIPNSSQCC